MQRRLTRRRFLSSTAAVLSAATVHEARAETATPTPVRFDEYAVADPVSIEVHARPLLSFDTRDNVFTPNSGNYLELSAGLFSKALGGDSDFQRVNITAMHYQPLTRELHFGILASTVMSFGDVPFYLRPYIALRGVPVMPCTKSTGIFFRS